MNCQIEDLGAAPPAPPTVMPRPDAPAQAPNSPPGATPAEGKVSNIASFPAGPARQQVVGVRIPPRRIPAATARQTTAPASQEPTSARLAAMDEYRPAHIDAKDAIAFAALRMKEYYDARHLPKFLEVGASVNLRLHCGYQVPAIRSKKLGPQFVGPFKVLE